MKEPKLTSERILELIDDVNWEKLDNDLKSMCKPLERKEKVLEQTLELKLKEIEDERNNS